MKLIVALLTAAVSAAASNLHAHHNHQHLHKKDATEVQTVPGPTVIAYVLNGQPISEEEVQLGIANGTLVFVHGTLHHQPQPSPQSYAAPESSAPPTYTSEAAPTYSQPAPSPSPSSSGGDGSSGVDSDFPDGQLPCSHFPSDYGAVPLDYLGLGGWSGIQSPGSDSGGYGNIMTVTSGQCSDGVCCGEGDFCSYACPAGYQKAQWPPTQGNTGQSVGGIQCQGGKLHLTNSALSSKLCIGGASQVTVQVQNTLGQNVAVCRTDYPGTESETIPVNAGPGETQPLACPDASNYYTWQGAHTSAQYYVNPAGVSQQDACQWGSPGNPWGNYAPLNLGVGYSDGAAWLSIFQNSPTTDAKLDFSVEIQGDGISGTCKYSNGQYCGGANYNDCSSTTGCTVSQVLTTSWNLN
jgi:hypothetical protein